MEYHASTELCHHGIKGQRWGVRRFQNYDGTRTAAGKSRETGKKTSSNDTDDRTFIEKYKKQIIAGIAIAGVAAGVGIAYKQGLFDNIGLFMGSEGPPDSVLDDNILEKAKNKTVENVNKAIEEVDYHEALYKSLNDEEFTLQPGTIIRREVGKKDTDPSKEKRALFTSFTTKDAKIYRESLKDWQGTGERYEVTMQLQKELKVPSKATAEEIFNGLYNNDAKFRQNVEDSLYKAHYNAAKYAFPKADRKRLKEFAKKNAQLHLSEDGSFKAGMYALVNQGKDSKKYYAELQKKGYNALIDYEDRDSDNGMNVLAPLIVIENSALTKIGEEYIGKFL